MSTPRQITANRGNAQASTGPRTKAGKGRASRNARRHGLSVPVSFDAALSGQVEELARRIVGETATAEVMAMARRFAEAQVDLKRIRQVRHLVQGLTVGMSEANGDREDDRRRREWTRQLRTIDRYERRALARRKAAAKAFDHAFMAAVRFQGLPPTTRKTAGSDGSDAHADCPAANRKASANVPIK